MKSWLVVAVLCFYSQLASADDELSIEADTVSAAGNDFAMDLYNVLADNSDGGNVFFSPLSIHVALAMTYVGARGNTKTEMSQVLGFNDQFDSDTELYGAYQELLEVFNDRKNNYTLDIANRLFGRQDFNFLEEFLNTTRDYFMAGLQEMDFANNPEASRVQINEWVEEKTRDKIQELLKEGTITTSTAMVLVNAIYFKGNWSIPFDPEDTESRAFYTSNDRSTDVDMMFIENYFNYAEASTIDSKILELPYAGDEVSMFIILPNERTGLAQLEDDLDDEDLDQLFQLPTEQKVEVLLPKFTLTQEMSLKSVLGRLGMRDLFDATAADLSGLNEDGGLYVTEVVHKAFIDVDEEGTEAAAATGVIVGLTSVLDKPRFQADHPFMFFIVEKSSGSVLFMGRLTQPADEGQPIGEFGRAYDITDGAGFVSLNSVLLMVMSILFGALW